MDNSVEFFIRKLRTHVYREVIMTGMTSFSTRNKKKKRKKRQNKIRQKIHTRTYTYIRTSRDEHFTR